MSRSRAPNESKPQVLNESDRPLPADFTPLRLVLHPGGLSVLLERTSATIGRHSGCDIRLPSPDVSRRHCRVWFENGVWWLADLGSTNGVYLNGERIAQRRLQAEDQIRICDFTIVTEPIDAPRPVAIPVRRRAS